MSVSKFPCLPVDTPPTPHFPKTFILPFKQTRNQLTKSDQQHAVQCSRPSATCGQDRTLLCNTRDCEMLAARGTPQTPNTSKRVSSNSHLPQTRNTFRPRVILCAFSPSLPSTSCPLPQKLHVHLRKNAVGRDMLPSKYTKNRAVYATVSTTRIFLGISRTAEPN